MCPPIQGSGSLALAFRDVAASRLGRQADGGTVTANAVNLCYGWRYRATTGCQGCAAVSTEFLRLWVLGAALGAGTSKLGAVV
jgi:hypothetical protein